MTAASRPPLSVAGDGAIMVATGSAGMDAMAVPAGGTAGDLDVAAVLERARAMGFDGFGGRCGEAAVAINRVVFGGAGVLVGAFNAAFLEHDRLVGHVCVRVGDAHWDSDGWPKAPDEIESWGMLDTGDTDYIETAGELGIEWDDEAAGGVDFVGFDDEDEVLERFGRENLDGMVAKLERAVAMVRGEAADDTDEQDAGPGLGMR